MKIKKGDYVKVKSHSWYNSNKDENGNIWNNWCFCKEMQQFCGKILEVTKVEDNVIYTKGTGSYVWQDWMLEGLVVIDSIKCIPFSLV